MIKAHFLGTGRGFSVKEIIATDTELVDEICLENEQSAQRMR